MPSKARGRSGACNIAIPTREQEGNDVVIKRILEIGVAVEDLRSAGGPLVTAFGAEAGDVVRIDAYQMLMQMYRIGNVEFELMQPAQPNSVIAKYLKHQDQGLHHIAFQVNSIEGAVAWMKRHQVRVINEEPVLEHGLKAVFLHPSSLGGVLIELIEGDPAWVGGGALPENLQGKRDPGETGVEGIMEIGIVVSDLESSLTRYSELFMGTSSGIMDLDNLGIRIGHCRVGNVYLKLMEAKYANNYLRMSLSKDTPGLHHVTLKAKNILQELHRLEVRGFSLVVSEDQSSRTRSIFVEPGCISGVCVQLKDTFDRDYI